METYFTVIDHGRLGRESIIDWERQSKADIIRDILAQDYHGKLIEVHCIDHELGTWTDVTEDIAREIFGAIDYEPDGDLLEFLESQLGCETMAEWHRELAGAA